jgi:release factor glutamine methyltransferase
MSGSGRSAQRTDGLIAQAAERLAAAGLEQPRLEASLLLASVLGRERASLLAHPDGLVEVGQAARFQSLVGRRARREPFAYLIGEREFYGRRFLVDRRALVPRPETELLVELALRDRALLPPRPLVIDVGTGSGCLAVTLAAELPDADVIACDRSAEALDLARANAARFGLSDRLRFVRGDLLSWLGRGPDLVVANLPYLPSDTLSALEPEVRDYEPLAALDGGADGTVLIRRLLREAAALHSGLLLAELDPRHAAQLLETARQDLPRHQAALEHDLAGRPRVLTLRAPTAARPAARPA